MIAFAFEWYVYLLSYLMVGVLSVLMILVFMIYHRIIAKIRPVPKFKFCSYLKLTIPPAIYGIILAIVPVLVVLSLISIFISGHLMNISTPMFSCDE